MGLPRKDDIHHTYGEYLEWGGDERFELIDGLAYLMAPAPTLDHQEFAGEIYYQLRQALDGRPCRPFIAPVDVRLPRGDEADARIDTVVQPDVFIVCSADKIDRRGIRGAPDWIAEILSPATAAHDHIVKRRVYERAGVPEYWLVHPQDRTATLYTLAHGQYGRPEVVELKGTTALITRPELQIAWDALIARLPKPEY